MYFFKDHDDRNDIFVSYAYRLFSKFWSFPSFLSNLFFLKTFFASYTREFRRVLVNIREKCRAGGTNEVEDWSHFQHSLRIIQTCGEWIALMQSLQLYFIPIHDIHMWWQLKQEELHCHSLITLPFMLSECLDGWSKSNHDCNQYWCSTAFFTMVLINHSLYHCMKSSGADIITISLIYKSFYNLIKIGCQQIVHSLCIFLQNESFVLWLITDFVA